MHSRARRCSSSRPELDTDRSRSGAAPFLPQRTEPGRLRPRRIRIGHQRSRAGEGLSGERLSSLPARRRRETRIAPGGTQHGRAHRGRDPAIGTRSSTSIRISRRPSGDGLADPAPRQQRRIGYWYWELEKFPANYLYAFDLVDEVWVASEFVRAAVASATAKPVIKIPALRSSFLCPEPTSGANSACPSGRSCSCSRSISIPSRSARIPTP